MKSIKTICIVRLSALGDCVLLVPTIRRIQAALPDAKITWIISEDIYPLFESISGVEFIPIKKPRSLRDYLALRKQLATYRFDVLLATQASLRVNLIYPMIKADRKIGFDKNRARDLQSIFTSEQVAFNQEHLLDGFQAFATKLNLPQSNNHPYWGLRLRPMDEDWADDFLGYTHLEGQEQNVWVALNPAASKIERCCSSTFYADIVNRLINEGYKVVLTGGPSDWEKALANDIAGLISSEKGYLNLVGQTTILQLAAILSKVKLLIAPDTGPVHIAGAFGTPVVGLYAVAPPWLSGPYQYQDLVVNLFPEAVRTFLKKDPLKVPWGTRVHHEQAMSLFESGEVLEEVLRKVSLV